MSRPTHYETLEVSSSASHEEIRRAYYTEARRWHPDRFNDRSAADTETADDSMREVNEAWRVLRDQNLRKSYDRSLADATIAAGRTGIEVDGEVTRIDPRLLDPEFLLARRQASSDYIDHKRSTVLRFAPWVTLVALLVGIFVFTAYQGDDRPATVSTTLSGPDVGVPANACVRIIGGPQLLEIPCTGVYDGRVIGAFEVGGRCPEPAFTIRQIELSNGITVCLGA